MRAARLVLIHCFWAGVLETTSVYAQSPKETLRLQYSAPSACPNQRDFEEQVLSFSPDVAFVTPGPVDISPPPRSLTVRIKAQSEGYRAELLLADVASDSSRVFEDRECQDLVEALALSTALALSPSEQPDSPGPLAVPVEQSARPSASPTPLSPPDEAPAPESSAAPTVERYQRHQLLLGLQGGWSEIQVQLEDGAAGLDTRFSHRPFAALKLRYGYQAPRWGLAVAAEIGYSRVLGQPLRLDELPYAGLDCGPVLRIARRFYAGAGLNLGFLRHRSQQLAAGSTSTAIRTRGYWGARLFAEIALGHPSRELVRLGLYSGITVPWARVDYLSVQAEGTALQLRLLARVAPEVGLSLLFPLF